MRCDVNKRCSSSINVVDSFCHIRAFNGENLL